MYVLTVALSACAGSGRKGSVVLSDFSSKELAIILGDDRNDEREVLVYPDAVVLYKSTYDKGFEDGHWLRHHVNARGTKMVVRYKHTVERCLDEQMTNCGGLKDDAVGHLHGLRRDLY